MAEKLTEDKMYKLLVDFNGFINTAQKQADSKILMINLRSHNKIWVNAV